MPRSKKPNATRRKSHETEGDKFNVVVRLPHRDRLGQLSRHGRLDVGGVRPTKGEGIEVTLFATRKQIAELEKAGFSLEVGRNLSVVGRERQAEVGKGDRFQRGKKPPKGLGTKTGKEG